MRKNILYTLLIPIITLSLLGLNLHFNRNRVIDAQIEVLKKRAAQIYPIASLMETQEGLKITWREK